MILYKFFAIAFLILTPIFAFIIHRFFSLKYLGLNFADLTFPLYFIEVVAVSARFFTHSFLPYITILLSLAAIIITIQMLRKTQSFKFKRFLKLFWRISCLFDCYGIFTICRNRCIRSYFERIVFRYAYYSHLSIAAYIT